MNLSLSRARASTAFQVLKEALPEVLEKGSPADAFLARKFRQEKRFGSKDRRYIRDIVFSYFRWRGAVLAAFPEEVEPCLSGVTAALLAEDFPQELLSGWLELGEIPPQKAEKAEKGTAPLERISIFSGKDIAPESVLPEWTRSFLDIRFAEWFQKRSCIWLRSTESDLPELLKKHNIEVVPHETIPNAFRCLSPNVNLYNLEEYRSGLFEVQDLSSQCIGLMASPVSGESWWDSCAGAGGKTLQLLSMMQNKGKLLSSDVSSVRLEELKKRIARTGAKIQVRTFDLTKPLPGDMHRKFDGVLVDAPCSSSGRWRRNPETRWQSSPERVKEFAELQEKILNNAAEAVKPGGILVYATCSIFTEENENQVEKFLNFHFDFALDEKGCILPNDNKSGMLRVSPWDADCDASFAARLRRKELPEDASPPQR
ncbi:MAG: RsmB/NOP family class I SAM-dependent RNA methyltransferase [Lentisphaeria bacterium]|nr:RsmB/NOP family class I SAM-dependent RNA methyltransferase [Lentisphaeria bacterium]